MINMAFKYLVDAATTYCNNVEVYVGQQPEGPFRANNDPCSIVLRLIQPISGTNRNLTGNFLHGSVRLGATSDVTGKSATSVRDHESTSEASIQSSTSSESDDEDNGTSDDKFYFGKNRCYKWSKECPKTTRTRMHNLVICLPGTKNEARNVEQCDILSAWQLLIPEDFLRIIWVNTNNKISKMQHHYKAPQPAFVSLLDMTELRAFIGLLYLSGIMKSNYENVEGLFANDGTGRDIFRTRMSLKRFLFMLTCLRFDCAATREARRANDKVAAIREVWDIFIANCQKYYTPSQNVTIDGQVRTENNGSFYLCNVFVYTSKETTNDKTLSIPTKDVLKLITPSQRANRNITVDNWFMSLELCEMKKKNLTVLGTMKQNKPQIPVEFKPHRKRHIDSTLFGHNQEKT
ncbi:piggybac transposable element-derived protein 4 [Holotrichia oblita]|uniref:Piggybac transposable element-derived protein 4 n=1 Tax=Holotrichia oblita TaxID=644536 RepID=A0ACB9TY12_HOLOL|nr:piggybac transposable element-derived protein 4 [Holotrichia oblita]